MEASKSQLDILCEQYGITLTHIVFTDETRERIGISGILETQQLLTSEQIAEIERAWNATKAE